MDTISFLIIGIFLIIPFIGFTYILKGILKLVLYILTLLIRFSFFVHIHVTYILKFLFSFLFCLTEKKGGEWWASFNEGVVDLFVLVESNELDKIIKQEEEKLMVKPVMNKSFDYVISSERNLDSEDQTTWELKPIPAREMYRIRDRLVESRGMAANTTQRINMGTQEYDILRRGIIGWRRFGDVNFKKDSKGFVEDTLIDMIPPDVRGELSAAIQNGPEYDHAKALREAQEEVNEVPVSD